MNQFARPGLGVTELPPVNADDNGKVLGVSDGAWAKVAASGGSDLPDDPAQDGTYNLQNTVSSGTGTLSWASGSSGGGVLVVNMVYDEVKDKDYTDKTWKEIHDAPMAVIVQEVALSGDNRKTIGSVIQAKHQNGEYSVSYYVLSLIGEITVSNLVTDSENGYLTYAE